MKLSIYAIRSINKLCLTVAPHNSQLDIIIIVVIEEKLNNSLNKKLSSKEMTRFRCLTMWIYGWETQLLSSTKWQFMSDYSRELNSRHKSTNRRQLLFHAVFILLRLKNFIDFLILINTFFLSCWTCVNDDDDFYFCRKESKNFPFHSDLTTRVSSEEKCRKIPLKRSTWLLTNSSTFVVVVFRSTTW